MEKHSHSQPDALLLRPTAHFTSDTRSSVTTSSDFVLQWGNRKRMRCMKVQVRDRDKDGNNNNAMSSSPGPPIQRTTVRVDRRVVRSDHNKDVNHSTTNAYLNLRQRPASPSHRILRNSEGCTAMRGGGHSNVVRGVSSPDRGGGGGASDKRVTGHNHHHNNNNNHTHTNNHNNLNHNNNNNHHHMNGGRGGSVSSETAHDSKKGGGNSSGSDAMPIVWPPKFVIALTNKEKEEDFMAIKGSKPPQRPKKRAKFVQRTLNLISPGAWLCDLTLERYEVREKKVSKKRPRGLKAMGNMDSDSE